MAGSMLVVLGFACSNDTGTAAQASSACGDGVKTGSEECDDGNADDGDGCSSVCTSEAVHRTDEEDPLTSAEQGLNGPAINAECNDPAQVTKYQPVSDLYLNVCAIAFNDGSGTDQTALASILGGVQSYLDVVGSRIQVTLLDVRTTEVVEVPGLNLANIAGEKQLAAVAKYVQAQFEDKCDAYFIAVNMLSMTNLDTQALQSRTGTALPLGNEVPCAVVTHATLAANGAARWATHELLHVVGLRHLNREDYCADTPPTTGCSSKCEDVPCNPLESPVITANVMSYYDCLPTYLGPNALTPGQVLRARCYIQTALGSSDCAQPTLEEPLNGAKFTPNGPITFSWASNDTSHAFSLTITLPDGSTKDYAPGTKTSFTVPGTDLTHEGTYIWSVDPSSLGLCDSTPRNFEVRSIPCGNVAPGVYEHEACGFCGTRRHQCLPNGTFGAWEDCLGAGVCAKGEKKTCVDMTEAACSNSCQWDKICKFATVLDPPDLLAPANFSINVPAAIALDWSDVPDATSYELQVAPTGAGLSAGNSSVCPTCVVNQAVTSGSQITLPSGALADGSTYSWQVRGAGTEKIGMWSSAWQFTTSAPLVVSEVNVGDGHSCARKSDSSLYCWGKDDKRGMLGLGENVIIQTTPAQVRSANGSSFLADVRQVSLGHEHTCAVVGPMNDVYCWGGNMAGEVGVGDTVNRYYPTKVNLTGVTQIRAGNYHTCALKQGIIYCWGQVPGTSGLGNDFKVPVDMSLVDSGFTNADAISAGESHDCLLKGMEAYCWGDNIWGQLGNGSFDAFGTHMTPTRVNSVAGGALTVVQLPTHQGYGHSCIDSGLDSPFCWGENTGSQLGPLTGATCASATPCSTKPVAVPLNNLAEVQVGEAHSCGRLKNGTIWCWGSNGAFVSQTPAQILKTNSSPLVGIQLTVGSGSHSCILDSSRKIYCWGSNSFGQLGDGSQNSRTTASLVSGL